MHVAIHVLRWGMCPTCARRKWTEVFIRRLWRSVSFQAALRWPETMATCGTWHNSCLVTVDHWRVKICGITKILVGMAYLCLFNLIQCFGIFWVCQFLGVKWAFYLSMEARVFQQHAKVVLNSCAGGSAVGSTDSFQRIAQFSIFGLAKTTRKTCLLGFYSIV